MDKQFVSDLAPNVRVASCFAVREKSLAPFRNKPGKFLNLTLMDRTGDVKGRMWDRAEEIAEQFDVGDVVLISGRVDEYQGQLQIIINEVVPATEDQYDPGDLVMRSGRTHEELLEWLDDTVNQVQDPHLKALLEAFTLDEPFRERFAGAHGAKGLHHCYVGGLLEHTLSVVELLKAVAALHPELDLDLLIAGGLLHDVGKLEELDGIISADYTDAGRLLGHTVLGDRMVMARMAQVEDFPRHTADMLSHMLLSHRGERQWGAPVVPATMEACALHYADNMDARVQGFKQVIAAEGGGSAHWSSYHRSYERQIYLGPTGETRQDTAGASEDAPGEATTGQDDGGNAQPTAQLDL